MIVRELYQRDYSDPRSIRPCSGSACNKDETMSDVEQMLQLLMESYIRGRIEHRDSDDEI